MFETHSPQMKLLFIQHLLQEHRAAEEVLKEMDSFLKALANNPQPKAEGKEAFRRLVRFLDEDLSLHIRKEEEILFPALQAFLSSDVGPLAVLRGEHDMLRDDFQRLRRDSAWLWAGTAHQLQIAEKFRRLGDAAVQRLRDHIYKEDRILFPMVERLLSEEQGEEIFHRMEAMGLGADTRSSLEQAG